MFSWSVTSRSIHEGFLWGSKWYYFDRKDNIIFSDVDVATELNSFFADAITSLNMNVPIEYINQAVDTYDPINTILVKYSKHPSILKIRCALDAPHFTFNKVGLAELELEIITTSARGHY